MRKTKSARPLKPMTPSEFRKLPAKEKNAILRAAAELMREEYLTNPELCFDPYGGKDTYGERSNSEARRRVAR